ncbi:hypothetical protein LC612_42665 [Nostoc sp. CHAB 5834]|nr:hypothetical protein [Nostoc sp. CHAB 5834]
MKKEDHIHAYGLRIAQEDAEAVRHVLNEQIRLETVSSKYTEEDLMKVSCVQLFSLGNLEDVLLIWEAKNSSMDAGCYIDAQLLCGAGFDPTVDYLKSLDTKVDKDALEWILEVEQAGEFDEFSPESYIQYYEKYFSNND